MSSIEQTCFWLATRRDPAPDPILDGSQRAEFVVVGAGFTGLWSAYFLKELNPGADVAVVEQGVAGYGGSGRNAGMISTCIDHTHALAKAHFGPDDAARLAKIGLQNIDEMAAFATDCDLERSGTLLVALSHQHVDDCRDSIKIAEDMGLSGYRFLTAEETKAELNSPLYLGAAFNPGGGIVNPVKLVDKIKSHCKAVGVRFFERSPVTSIANGVVTTQSGSIKADKIILATDSYSHHLFPELLWRYIPLYDYIVVSEPLTKEQHEILGWKGRQGVTDCRSFFNYYRLTADNRVLWGTSEAMYYSPNGVGEQFDHNEAHYEELKHSWQRHFPELKDLNFPYRWGGPIASTTRLTPFFGTLHGGNVIYGLGYTGHGIGSTRVAGKILAHLCLARPSELLNLKLVKEKPFPYPPEPFRKIAVKVVTGSLKRVDQGEQPGALLKLLDIFGIGFSS